MWTVLSVSGHPLLGDGQVGDLCALGETEVIGCRLDRGHKSSISTKLCKDCRCLFPCAIMNPSIHFFFIHHPYLSV